MSSTQLSTRPELSPASGNTMPYDYIGEPRHISHLPHAALPGLDIETLLSDEFNPTLPVDTDEVSTELMHEIVAELAFIDVEPELEEAVTVLGPQLSGRGGSEIHDEILTREKAFFTKIFVAALNMADAQSGPVNLLFDVDYTIAHHDARLARPAFGLVVRELDNILGDRLQVGLLTTRSNKGEEGMTLDSELHHPTYTAGLTHKLNPDLLISSLDLERSDRSIYDLVHGTDTAAKLAAVKDVLDPRAVKAVRQGQIDVNDFFDTKLIVLQELSETHPDQAFVVIDDLPLASAVRHDSSSVKGVRVNEQILDKLLQPYQVPSKSPQLR